MKQQIQSNSAPKAIGPYSQAIKVGNTIYFSGQIPLDPITMALVPGGFSAEANQVLANLQEMAKAAGGSLNDIVKLTIYLTDLAFFTELNDAMMRFFKEPFPARTTIQVSALPKAAQIEIDAIMVI